MFQKYITPVIVGSLVGLVLISLPACQMNDRTYSATSTNTGTAETLGRYAQMDDGSVVVDGHQLNWMVSDWGGFPYAAWMYLEVNEQAVIDQQPGDHQIPVALANVVLSFSALPAGVREILIGVKAVHDDTDRTFTERGRFAVIDGRVSIPLEYADLVYYFGITHYSLWFQALGGDNGQGIACGQITLSGMRPDGQPVTFTKAICFGTNPAPASTPTVVSPYLDVVVTVGGGGSTSDIAEFDLQEPGGAKMGLMFDDGSVTTPYYEDQTTGDADSVLVDTLNWTSAFHMYVPAGATLTGQYQAVVQNNWTDMLGPGNCPATDPLPVTITVKTHAATQTFTCHVTCDSGVSATIGATFPAGTIQSIACP